MKVKIISDGTCKNTTVIDTKTGEALEGVTHIDWHIEAPHLAKCTIKLHNIPLEVIGDKIKSYELSNEK
jgi:hypothetical protein